MDADWSVELGADDPALEFPWSSPDESQRFVDLKDTVAINEIPEALQYPELQKCLLELNSRFSPWLTVKCDVWLDHELGEAEQIYDANLKVCSYVDLIRRDDSARYSFDHHEWWVKSVTGRLHNLVNQPNHCELIVRRCWYHTNTTEADELTPGFYITAYVSGYGNNEEQARERWSSGITKVSWILSSLAS